MAAPVTLPLGPAQHNAVPALLADRSNAFVQAKSSPAVVLSTLLLAQAGQPDRVKMLARNCSCGLPAEGQPACVQVWGSAIVYDPLFQAW